MILFAEDELILYKLCFLNLKSLELFYPPDPESSFRRVHDVRNGPEDRFHVTLLKQDHGAEVVLPEDRSTLGSEPRQRLVTLTFF
jgi:hypothetical protein